MTKVNPEALKQEISDRLSAMSFADGACDDAGVAAALESHFQILEIPMRPIRWARDGQHAQALVAESDVASAKQELELAQTRVFGGEVERILHVWTDARNQAKEAGLGAQLEVVRTAVQGYPVILSVPWNYYQGQMTGDRGRRTHPAHSPTWEAAQDALEYAARAAAECAVDIFYERKRRTYQDLWLHFLEAFEAGLWLFWLTADEIIALARPVLGLNDARQLHAADGPAIRWPDGDENFFFLNGVHVPEELVTTPAREMDPRIVLRERNTGVRRELVRKIGLERICEALHAQSIDRQGDYELLLLDLQDGRMRPFLKMRNPSIGVYHIEGVAPDCRTVAEALAWRNQSDVPPSILT